MGWSSDHGTSMPHTESTNGRRIFKFRTLLYAVTCSIPMRTEMGPKMPSCSIHMRTETTKFRRRSDPIVGQKWQSAAMSDLLCGHLLTWGWKNNLHFKMFVHKCQNLAFLDRTFDSIYLCRRWEVMSIFGHYFHQNHVIPWLEMRSEMGPKGPVRSKCGPNC
jgi:hypothetical protein